jgi:hypothetical protein
VGDRPPVHRLRHRGDQRRAVEDGQGVPVASQRG